MDWLRHAVKHIWKEATFISLSRHHNWSSIPAIEWTSIYKNESNNLCHHAFKGIVRRNQKESTARVPAHSQSQNTRFPQRYLTIFGSCLTWSKTSRHTNAWESSTQISQYVRPQWIYYTTTFTCSHKWTGNEQYKYLGLLLITHGLKVH